MTKTAPGASIPKLDLIHRNPDAAAAISKAIRPQFRMGFDFGKKETHGSLNQSKIQAISDTSKERRRENEDILSLFPDILLAEQIVVSSVLAPKDMFSQNLIYKGVQKLVPSTVQSKIDAVVKKHMEGHYDIQSELAIILRDAIFRAGSYVSAVMPEAAVDQIINGKAYAAESHKSFVNEIIDSSGRAVPLGILGPPKANNPGVALENFFSGVVSVGKSENAIALEGQIDSSLNIRLFEIEKPDTKEARYVPAKTIPQKLSDYFTNVSTEGFLEITDNYQLLKLPKLTETVGRQRVKMALKNPTYSSYTAALESYGGEYGNDLVDPKKVNRHEFENLIYKNKRPESEMMTVLPGRDSQQRYSIGRPLRMRIPSEAVVPVFPPGDPGNHRGYFVLVDMDGNWVTRSSVDITSQGLQSLLSNQNQSNSMSSLVLNKANKAIRDTQPDIMLDNMLEIYSSVVENDMISRLKNGLYGTKLEVGHDKEWDRIMLARALAGKMTRIVYIPAEVITYYAFDYHENGVGKSYLDQVKMLTSLRAVLLFSKIMAELKNAINVTKVDMTLDPEDPDPQKTIEMAAHDIAKLRESYFPLGVNSPADLMQWIQRAGLMFAFKNHPGLPETSFEFSTANLQHQVPDQATSDDLRKQTFMTFGLTPEQVDEGFSAQFATTVIQQNALFARRILLLSDITAKHLSNDVRNICTNDPMIKRELRDILKEAKEDLTKHLSEEDKEDYRTNPDLFIQNFLDRVVDNIWVDLPKPDIGSTNNKAEAFKQYKEALTEVMTSFVSSEVFTQSFAGEFASHADEVKNFWIHYLLRKWVTDEGYMADISEIFNRDEDGKPSVMVKDTMIKYTQDALLSAFTWMKEQNKIKKATDADLKKMGIEEGPGAIGGGSSFGGSSDFGSDFGMGGGDLDLGVSVDDLTPPSEAGNEMDAQTTESSTTETTETTDGGTTTTSSSSSTEGGVGSFRRF